MNLITKLENELRDSKENKVYNNIKKLESPQGPYIYINNKKFDNMCSNNYLGWANDELTKNSAIESIKKFGVGPGAVRSISGTFSVHEEFEEALSRFKGVDSTLVVQSGFQANTTVIPTITTKEDYIISDQLNHASIIDGMRLSKANKLIYKHCDMDDLLIKLNEAKANISKEGNIFIITDGVFSMDGDIAPLDKINSLAKKYNAHTIVDDAHGEGVFGKNGRGVVSHFDLCGEIDIEIGTLSKAFGLVGGFIGGNKVLIEYLKQKSRPFLFSSSLDMSMCYAGIEILKVMERESSRVDKLWDNAKYIQNKFIKDGYSIGKTQSPITPFMVYDEKVATELTQKMYENNILVSPIIFPTVAKGQARIRIMVSSLHEKSQLDYVYEIVIREYKNIIVN